MLLLSTESQGREEAAETGTPRNRHLETGRAEERGTEKRKECRDGDRRADR